MMQGKKKQKTKKKIQGWGWSCVMCCLFGVEADLSPLKWTVVCGRAVQMMCSDALSGAVMGTWLQSVCLDLPLFLSLSFSLTHTGRVDTMHLACLCSSALSNPHLVLQQRQSSIPNDDGLSKYKCHRGYSS